MSNRGTGVLFWCAIAAVLTACAAKRYQPAALPPFGSASDATAAPAPTKLRSLFYDEKCPLSEVDVRATETVPGVLTDMLIGGLADDVVSQLVSALNEAAKVDREGFTIRGKTSDYFYRFYPNAATNKLRVPRCLIIAEGVPVATANEASFCGGQCSDNVDPAFAEPIAQLLKLRSPSFYAEIHLTPADTRDAVRGQLVYLWYPAPLVKRRQQDRNLTLSVTVRKPNASAGDGDAASTMLFQLDGVVPGQEVKIGQLLTMGSWTGVPVFPSDEAINQVLKINTATPMPSRLGLAPVNVEVVINEKWRPNPFLQWLSRVLGTDANKAKLQTAVQAAVVPSQRAQAEKTEADAAFAAEQAYREARSKALQAQSTFLVKCGELTTATNQAVARLAVSVAQVAWEKEAASLRAAAAKVNGAVGSEASPDSACPAST
jgi:hypothetical protein